MYTINQITIIGFTGNDAEAYYMQNGTLTVTISVATKRHRIASFGRQSEFTRTLTEKYVMVQGAVRAREYEREGAKHCII